MRSFDAAKVFDNKLNWRLFAIFYSLIPTVLTISAQQFFMLLITEALREFIYPKIIYPMMKANPGGMTALYVSFGIMLIGWLTLHYFLGYLYVRFLSKVGGSKRSLLARTLAIVATIPWSLLVLFHVFMGFGFGPWFAAAFVGADLLFIFGMFWALRMVGKQSKVLSK
jgi:hypothetical protein